MLNNDVLRSLRYLLDLPDAHLAELAAPFGEQVEADLLEAYLKKEDEDGFQACPDRYLARCLDGLIIQRRGGGGGGAPPPGWISRRWRRSSARARPCVSPACRT
ncbi:DUF1456 family protein, partial [Pseudomonas aeruginosa]|uniref:DUF1456 family protein n=1 Tax=Pseudomonas aeruginosa TaxID=287 RepID=UPI001F49B41F